MKRQLKITIVGETGSGKSTMALLLEEFLKKKGLDVTMNIDNELFDYGSEGIFRDVIGKTKRKRLKGIAENTEINICQRQVNVNEQTDN